MTTRELVRQEIIAREQTIVGKVVRARKLVEFDGSSAVWVVDVDIGAEKVLKKVPVKGGSGLRRSYADEGQTVVLRRNALGRFDVVGPGDRVAGVTKTKSYDYATGTPTVKPDIWFGVQIESFDYYQGPENPSPGAPTENLTFTAGPPGTILRAGPGSWLSDGFALGKWFIVSNSASNDGYYGPLTGATATLLTIAGGLVAEGPSLGISIGWGSLWTDVPMPVRTTRDAQGNIVPA